MGQCRWDCVYRCSATAADLRELVPLMLLSVQQCRPASHEYKNEPAWSQGGWIMHCVQFSSVAFGAKMLAMNKLRT